MKLPRHFHIPTELEDCGDADPQPQRPARRDPVHLLAFVAGLIIGVGIGLALGALLMGGPR